MRRLDCKLLVLFCIIGLVTGLGLASSAAAKAITLNYLTPWPKNSYESKKFIDYMDEIQKEVDQKFPGELKLVYKGGPEVIPTLEQVEALRKGVVQMLQAAFSYYVSVMPELDLAGLTTERPWNQRGTGFFDYLNQLHNKKINAQFLGRPGIGVPFQIALNKPIKTVEDLKGMKLRASPTNIPFLKAVGAVPVGMPPSDIYSAMERGVVDGFVLPVYTAKDFGLVKATKYVVFPGLYEPSHAWLISLKVWNKMPKHLQDFLNDHAKKFERVNFEQIAKRHKAELEFFKNEGVQFIQLSPAEAEKFNNIARKALIDNIRKKVPEETEKILDYLSKMK
jgi:TRAP-type C4-dicarboxylate transport system substrate-binding protein